jgi:hypothetical protein
MADRGSVPQGDSALAKQEREYYESLIRGLRAMNAQSSLPGVVEPHPREAEYRNELASLVSSLKDARALLDAERSALSNLRLEKAKLESRLSAEETESKTQLLEINRLKALGLAKLPAMPEVIQLASDGKSFTISIGPVDYTCKVQSPGLLGFLATSAKNLKTCFERLLEAIQTDTFDAWESKYWKTYEQSRMYIESFYEGRNVRKSSKFTRISA